VTAQLSPQFYLAAWDESIRTVEGYNSILFARYDAYMMGNEL
jgi:hypothetical protein